MRAACAKGDVLAIYSPNVPEYAMAFHAASLVGGVVTTINPLYTAAEVAYQLEDAGARYLLTVGPFLEKAQQAARQAPAARAVRAWASRPGRDGHSPRCWGAAGRRPTCPSTRRPTWW